MRRRSRLLVPFIALAFTLGACGGDDADPEETDGGTTPTDAGTTEPTATSVTECPADAAGENVLNVRTSEALGELSFFPATLDATAGELTIQFDNPGMVPHSFVIEGTDIGMLASSRSQCTETVTLEAGNYTVYCDVAGHREAGMETTLTVT